MDKRPLVALEVEAGRGLIQMLLRRPLTEDPLPPIKEVEAKVIEQIPKGPVVPRTSIIPTSRPAERHVRKAPPLKPGEEVMD